jgi:uncharacterized protein YutE (UPF0331/DUF86 family)
MTPTLRARLDSLDEFLRDLREIQPPNFEAFERDKMLRRYAERLLHMTIDQCIQIGIEILTTRGFRAPENYHDVFTVLGDHGVLTPGLVNSMTRLVELRNLLVYEYDVLDHMMVYSALKRRLEDLVEFSRAVRSFAVGEPYVPSPFFQPELDDSVASP